MTFHRISVSYTNIVRRRTHARTHARARTSSLAYHCYYDKNKGKIYSSTLNGLSVDCRINRKYEKKVKCKILIFYVENS